MKRISFSLLLAVTFTFTVCAQGANTNKNPQEEKINLNTSGTAKILVVYFSQTGNTRTLANLIHQEIGGDIFRIETAIPYSSDMAALARRKNKELETGNMPELKSKAPNIESYNIIFLGYPIWAMTVPTPVRSFLESHDLTGKIIVPFCTHDGYGSGESVAVIKDLLPSGTTVLNVFDIKGKDAGKAGALIKTWLKKLKW
jgi:flavodoxin